MSSLTDAAVQQQLSHRDVQRCRGRLLWHHGIGALFHCSRQVTRHVWSALPACCAFNGRVTACVCWHVCVTEQRSVAHVQRGRPTCRALIRHTWCMDPWRVLPHSHATFLPISEETQRHQRHRDTETQRRVLVSTLSTWVADDAEVEAREVETEARRLEDEARAQRVSALESEVRKKQLDALADGRLNHLIKGTCGTARTAIELSLERMVKTPELVFPMRCVHSSIPPSKLSNRRLSGWISDRCLSASSTASTGRSASNATRWNCLARPPELQLRG